MFLKFAANVCRVCLGPEAKVSLFGGSGNDEKFKSATSLDISEEDGLPSTLCEDCSIRLDAAYEFQKQSLASDVRLRSFVNTINSKFASEIEVLHHKTFSKAATQVEADDECKSLNISNEKHTSLQIDIISDVAEISNQADEHNVGEDEVVAVNYSYNETVEDAGVTDDQEEKNMYIEETGMIECNFQEEEEEELSNYPSNRTKSSNVCRNCNKSFSNRTSLARHMLTHSNIKPYECPVCHALFTQNGSLKQHMLRHTGERPHICILCGRGFTRRRLLRMHERIHTGEKPYHCDECNISFTVKEGLRRHNIRKHSNVKVQVYMCELCEKKLHSKYTLRNHMQLHEKDGIREPRKDLHVLSEDDENDDQAEETDMAAAIEKEETIEIFENDLINYTKRVCSKGFYVDSEE